MAVCRASGPTIAINCVTGVKSLPNESKIISECYGACVEEISPDSPLALCWWLQAGNWQPEGVRGKGGAVLLKLSAEKQQMIP